MSQQQKCDGIQKPVRWYNGCNTSVPAALRFLANHDRPGGGESRFNSAHLIQLAGEIESMALRALYDVPPASVSLGKFLGLVEHCKFSDKRIAELTSQLNMVRLYEQKEVWYWQGDGEDHLESLVCPVVINAEDLRELLRKAVALAPNPDRATLAPDVEPVRAQLDDERTIARQAAKKAPEGATHCALATGGLLPVFLRIVDGLVREAWAAASGWDLVGPHYKYTAESQPSLNRKVIPLPCDGNHGGPRCADPECWNDEAAPVAAAWNGKGKPALGGWCEYRSADEEWIPCEVVAYRADQLVIVDALGYACVVGVSELRPARTPEQIAAEERIKAAQEWLKGVEREYGVEVADECENILMAAEAKRVAK